MAFTGKLGTSDSSPGNLVPAFQGGAPANTDFRGHARKAGTVASLEPTWEQLWCLAGLFVFSLSCVTRMK